MNMQGNLGRNIPQPQGMPQGIASLGGMSPSPRAGIGNVQDRVDAFRQNPQALQTPPNVPPDLLDALALQKIMSEKEAAKREMAMAQPGQQPTIMQQLEQKALGDTKQEIAQQVGGVAQKQEQDKQQAMQRLMYGIAQAPGAGQVMPARMAGGGIVAFQGGGLSTGFAPDYTDARRFGIDLSPYDSPKVRAEKLERLRKMREFEKYMAENRAEIPREEPPVQPDTMQAEEQRLLGRFPKPQEAPPQAPAMPAPPQGMRIPSDQVQPKPSAAPGIVGALQQPPLPKPPEGGIAVQPKPTPSLAEFMKGTGVDPEAARKARATEAAGIYGMSPEEKAFYEERIQRMRQEMQPKETRWYERLGDLAAQMGPASSSIAGTLGGVARTSRTMELDALAKRQKQQEQLDALRKEMLGGARVGREKAFEAGIGAEKASMDQQARLGQIGASLQDTAAKREGTASATSEGISNRESRERMTLAEIASKEKVAQQQIEAQAKTTGQIQLANRLAVANARVNDAIEGANKALKAKFGALATLMMMNPEEAKTKNPQQYNAYMQYERELKRQLIEPAIAERDRISTQITGGAPAVSPTQPQLPEGVKVTPRQGS